MATSQILDIIAQRYSCRAFSDKPIADDVLQAIVTAGLHAPSAVNRQPWRLIAVRDPAIVADIEAAGLARLKQDDPAGYQRAVSRGGTMIYHAPVVLIIAGEQGDKAAYSPIDCGIVASHIVLAATALGVDSCIAAMPRVVFAGDAGAAMRQRIGLPDGFGFTLSVLLGYASGEAVPGHEIDPAKATIL